MSSPQAARPKVTIWTGQDGLTPFNCDRDLLTIQTHEALSSPCHSFTLIMVSTTDADGREVGPSDPRRLAWLYGNLRPQQVVSLGIDEEGGILVGLIDQYKLSVSADGPIVRQSLTVSGKCVGKVLVTDHIVLSNLKTEKTADFIKEVAAALGDDHPLILYVRGTWGPEVGKDKARTFEAAAVADVARWVLSQTPSIRIPVLAKVFGGSGEAGDWMEVEATTWNDGRIYSNGLSRFQGNVWTFLQQVLDTDLYEVMVDYLPRRAAALSTEAEGRIPYVVLRIRPKPFDEAVLEREAVDDAPDLDWTKLRTYVDGLESHTIELEDVLSYDVTSGDADAYSHYLVDSRYALAGQAAREDEGLGYPVVDLYNAEKYGLVSHKGSMNLISPDVLSKSEGDVDTELVWDDVRRTRNRLLNWYWFNPRFMRGTVRVLNRDSFRVGDPITFPWMQPAMAPDDPFYQKGIRAYCIGISRSWTLGEPATATLEYVRGHNDGMVRSELAAIARRYFAVPETDGVAAT